MTGRVLWDTAVRRATVRAGNAGVTLSQLRSCDKTHLTDPGNSPGGVGCQWFPLESSFSAAPLSLLC